MKKFFFACFLTLVYAETTFAQFSDNFLDNDFTLNPAWQGDTDKFIINSSQQLALHSSAAGKSFLASAFSSPSAAVEWEFYIKQKFSPSVSNYARVYLMSDNANLTMSLNGYYLQFGEAGSGDAVELFRQTGSTSVSVCRGKNGSIASSFEARIRVTRAANGDWSIYTDFTAGKNFKLDASGSDQTYLTSSFLGVVCAYTSSNVSNFFFDDFYAGAQQIDTTPPTVQSVQVMSASELDIVFSESMEAASAETLSNYLGDNDLGNPVRAELQSDKNTVILSFAKEFPSQVLCSITINGGKDLAGNEMVTVSGTFLYSRPVAASVKDIIFNEIFADPNPQIDLPNAEFVEIFNRSATTINLTNWKITDGSSAGTFEATSLASGEYLILTSTSNLALFASFGNVLGLSNFPTLNNDGDGLVLKNDRGVTIDSVNYSNAWYRDDDKKEGGWSLELIDPNNTCAESENWIASEDIMGGTPGKQNSALANKPDLTGPKLLAAIVISPTMLMLKFDEKLDKNIPSISNFTVSPMENISFIAFSDPSLTSFNVSFENKIESKTLYKIAVQNVFDCAGNNIQEAFSKMNFSQTEVADSLDVVVNEILFNPHPTGVDFVEIYNNSTKFINLKNWSIANMEAGRVGGRKPITATDYLLYPASYAVLTESADIIKGEYPAAHEDTILKIKDMPLLNDDGGSVILINENDKVIDYLSYTKGMHSVFIKDEEGVSLERIAFNGPTNDVQNWKSASSTVGYATPGYLNSSARNESAVAGESIKVDPEIFIPIVGHPDFTQIHYNFEQGNYVANVKIMDTQGHEIKVLANNQVLGTQGSFRWDGDRDNGGKARVGYYLVRFEIFDSTGGVKTFHKRVVVATKF